MSYKSLEIRVGATIFIAALILSVGLMWFQGFQLQRQTYEILARFPMVGGSYIQMEDELASMCAILGASWAGVKSVTATSGPRDRFPPV